jgi:hypothetical protein
VTNRFRARTKRKFTTPTGELLSLLLLAILGVDAPLALMLAFADSILAERQRERDVRTLEALVSTQRILLDTSTS